MRNRMTKEEKRKLRKKNGIRIGKKYVLRQYCLSWWIVGLVVTFLFMAFMSIPGSIDAAAGMVPR
jgi:hypothetical protein